MFRNKVVKSEQVVYGGTFHRCKACGECRALKRRLKRGRRDESVGVSMRAWKRGLKNIESSENQLIFYTCSESHL